MTLQHNNMGNQITTDQSQAQSKARLKSKVSMTSLSPSLLTDLYNATDFSEEEIRDLYKIFKEECPNGIVTVAQFEKTFCEIFPPENASSFSQHVFRTFDKDKNGTIDFKEFLCALSVQSRGSLDDKLGWAFSVYDIDGDGHISREEMTVIVKALFTLAHSSGNAPVNESAELYAARLFRSMDKNNDERVTKEEFVQGALSDPTTVKLLLRDQMQM